MIGVQLEPATADGDTVVADVDVLDGAVRPQIGACLARHPFQLGRHRAHAADRHAPLAGAVAEAVEEEAAVLHQGRVVQRRVRPDQAVGANDPAHDVVAEAALERDTQRLLDDVGPRDHVDLVAHVTDVGERLQKRRGHGPAQLSHVVVKRLPGVELVVGAGQPAKRCTRRIARVGLDQQALLAVRGVRRGGPRSQLEPEPEVLDERIGHQAHEVGEPRQSGVEVVERTRTHRGSADVIEALEHRDQEPGAGQVGRGDEGVVATADDDDVLVCCHGRRERARRSTQPARAASTT